MIRSGLLRSDSRTICFDLAAMKDEVGKLSSHKIRGAAPDLRYNSGL
jgi:hypothetical protein